MCKQSTNTQCSRGVVYHLIAISTILFSCCKATSTYRCSSLLGSYKATTSIYHCSSSLGSHPPTSTCLLWSQRKPPTSTCWSYLLRCSKHPQLPTPTTPACWRSYLPPTDATPVLLWCAYHQPMPTLVLPESAYTYYACSGPARECLPVPAGLTC